MRSVLWYMKVNFLCWINASAIFVRWISHDFTVNNQPAEKEKDIGNEEAYDRLHFLGSWNGENSIGFYFLRKLCTKIGNYHCSVHTQWIQKRINSIIFYDDVYQQSNWKENRAHLCGGWRKSGVENETNQFIVCLPSLHSCCPQCVITNSNQFHRDIRVHAWTRHKLIRSEEEKNCTRKIFEFFFPLFQIDWYIL